MFCYAKADGIFLSLPDSLTPGYPLLPRGCFSRQIHPTRGLLARLPSVLPSREYRVSLQPGRHVTVGAGAGGGHCAQSQLFAVQVMVWNLDTKESVIMSPVKTIDCHQDVILSMSFNTDGSLLATTCKDRKIRVLDPRAGTFQVSARLGSGLGSEKQGVEWGWQSF